MPYIGNVADIPVGDLGLTGNKGQTKISAGMLLIAQNVTYEGDSLQKEGGALKYNSSVISGAPTVVGGRDWIPASGVQRMVVVLSDGTIKKDSGSGTFPTTLRSGLSLSGVSPVFIEGGSEVATNNRKLFLFTGTNNVQVLSGDGVTMTDLATPPADWATNKPVSGCIEEGRLWGAVGHRVYYSTTGNHEDFTGAGSGSIAVYPGEGERILGITAFKGLVVVMKNPKGLYLIDTSDPNVANWHVMPLTRSIGLAGSLAFCTIDNDILFMSPAGSIHQLSAVTEFGDMTSSDVTFPFKVDTIIRDQMNQGQYPRAQGSYYQAKREASFLLASPGSTVLNRRLVVDYNKSDLIRFRISDRDINESVWLRKDNLGIERPVIGDNAGFIYLLDQSDRSKDGAGYTGSFQTPHDDLGRLDPKLATMNKIADFLELVSEPIGNWYMSMDVMWDGLVKQTIQFNMGTSGAAIGSFTLGSSTLGGDRVQSKRKRCVGSGRRISFIGRNTVVSQNFSIGKLFLHFRPGSEDERI
jgi:hypothetical protein